ncbi:TetR/AcrR family transcriptional regulator [Paractinoplanes maris]|uniref:TetR/AcrR family transcriptional regulator n=1 Tax=Paractinoplanes maris TaxID=1734446 RepID=UPI00202024E0|nr:hypothetical protein [Actinoplanes maris]
MSSEQLRHRVVRAVTHLVSEWDTMTTSRIAEVVGVDEAELLAMFADKDAVMQAWVSDMTAHMMATLDPAAEVRRLEAVRGDQPVEARLLQVIDILRAYAERVRTELVEHPAQPTGRTDRRSFGIQPEFQAAVARLLEPDEHHLRLPSATLAELFLSMAQSCTRVPNEVQPVRAEHVVALFLHGALVRTAPGVHDTPGT